MVAFCGCLPAFRDTKQVVLVNLELEPACQLQGLPYVNEQLVDDHHTIIDLRSLTLRCT
jgi:hypothetical protein